MRELVPQRLWIGNAGDARNPAAVLDAGVASLVNLAAEELPPDFPRDILYCHFPLVDGPGNPPAAMRIAVATITALLREEIPALVYCGAGMSRSVAVAAAAIGCWRGDSLEDTLKTVSDEVPHDVSPVFWHDLRTVIEQTLT